MAMCLGSYNCAFLPLVFKLLRKKYNNILLSVVPEYVCLCACACLCLHVFDLFLVGV